MLIRKITALLLAILFAAAASAGTAITEFIAVYNEYADENSAPRIDSALLYSDDAGWYITFADSTCVIGISFDSAGYADVMMLDADCGDETALKAFLNAWFVSDSELVYAKAEAIIRSAASKDGPETAEYMGWYVARSFVPANLSGMGTERVSIGIVWIGEESSEPLPSATPAAPGAAATPSPTTYNGKPVYKA